MSLKQRINDDLKAALLGGDRFRTETLRGLKAVILNEEVAKNLREEGISDDAIEQLIAREVKKRSEAVTMYRHADRSELAENEEREAAVLAEYLPVQLSDDELRDIVSETIETLNAEGPSAMGQVIGAVKARVGTSADGAAVARIVKEALQK